MHWWKHYLLKILQALQGVLRADVLGAAVSGSLFGTGPLNYIKAVFSLPAWLPAKSRGQTSFALLEQTVWKLMLPPAFPPPMLLDCMRRGGGVTSLMLFHLLTETNLQARGKNLRGTFTKKPKSIVLWKTVPRAALLQRIGKKNRSNLAILELAEVPER